MIKVFIDENFSSFLAEGLNILEKPNKEDFEVVSVLNEFGPGTTDEVLIFKIGKQHGIWITQDLHIAKTRQLCSLYKSYNLGIFFYKPPSKNGFSYWEMVKQLINKWEEIKKIIKRESRPFAYRTSSKKSGFEKMEM